MNYNNNLGFIFTFLLGGMAFISLLHTHRNLSGLTVVSISSKPVFARETARLKVTLAPALTIHPSVILHFSGDNQVDVTLKGLRDNTVEVPLKTSVRGRCTVPPLIISTSYPFGLFRAWAIVRPDTRILVYPEILPGTFLASPDFSGRDNEGHIEVTGVDDFKGLKQYAPGDPMNRISWKVYSKGHGLQIKEFSGQTGASIVLDWYDIPETDKEKRLSRLCDRVLKAHNLNLSYGLKLPGLTIAPGEAKDLRHRHECLKALALFHPVETAPGENR
jgi:uncharacterized protein (DUF58 family)